MLWAAVPFGLLAALAFTVCAANSSYLQPNPWESPWSPAVIAAMGAIGYWSGVSGLLRYGEYGSWENPKAELRDIKWRQLFKQFLACLGLSIPQVVATASHDNWRYASLLSLCFVLKVIFPSAYYLDEVLFDRVNYANRREFLTKLGQPKRKVPHKVELKKRFTVRHGRSERRP